MTERTPEQALIWGVCEEIAANDGKVTNQSVLDALRARDQGKSMGVIAPVVKEYKASHRQTAAVAEPVSIPDAVKAAADKALEQMWTAAESAADTKLDAERAALKQAQAELEDQEVELYKGYDDLQRQIDTLTSQRDQAQQLAEETIGQLEKQSDLLDDAGLKIAAQKQQITDAKAEAAAEREAAALVQEKAGKVDGLEQALAAAQQLSESLQAQLDAAVQQAASDKETIERLRGESRSLTEKLTDEKVAAADAKASFQGADGQVSLLKQQVEQLQQQLAAEQTKSATKPSRRRKPSETEQGEA